MYYQIEYKCKSDIEPRFFAYNLESEEDHLLGELLFTNEFTGQILIIRRTELEWYKITAVTNTSN